MLRLATISLVLFAMLSTIPAARALEPAPGKMAVYFGTSTRGSESVGIYHYELDMATGRLTPKATAALPNPGFLALHPTGQYLYAVTEVEGPSGKTGGVAAFRIDPATGNLTALNTLASGSVGPCHLSVDKTGKTVLVAHYSGGSVSALPIKPNGEVGEVASLFKHEGSSVHPRRQQGAYAHSVNVDLANARAFVADLGIDQVVIYNLDPAQARLSPNDPPYARLAPGAGPRHLAFHPSGKFVYVNNELNSTLTAFRYDAASGALTEINTVATLPDDFDRDNNTTAEVQVHPNGKFVYVSNRGHDSIAIFAVDAESGAVSPAGHQPTGGSTPRNFGIDPTGTYLVAANQATNNVFVFRINGETGQLTPTGNSAEIPAPICVKFLPLP